MDFSTALKGMAGDIYSDRPHYEVVLNLLKIAKSENSRAGSLWSAFNRGLSAIFTPQSTLDWAKFLTFVAKARQCGAINPKLIGKPFEHYAVEGLNTEERLRLLTGNYFSSLRLLTPQIFHDLWQKKKPRSSPSSARLDGLIFCPLVRRAAAAGRANMLSSWSIRSMGSCSPRSLSFSCREISLSPRVC